MKFTQVLSSSRTPIGLFFIALVAVACDVDQTQEGEMPDVDVSADAGNLPEYEIVQTEEGDMPDVDVDTDAGRLPSFDVDWADVSINMTEETITVPKLEVVMEEETISVPVIDVDMPNDDDNRNRVRRTLTATAMVPGDGYSLEIARVYRANDSLIVVSRLEGQGRGDSKQMVNDSVVINAPEADVHHVIIGQRPAESYNEQYRYVNSMRALERELGNAKLLYEG